MSFKTIKRISLWDEICESSHKYNSWYVARDNSSNSVCCNEIRIKFSENCYQAVPSIKIDEIYEKNIVDSFITFITESKLSDLSSKIVEILKKGNKLIVITTEQEHSSDLDSYISNKSLSVIHVPSANKYFSFLPIVHWMAPKAFGLNPKN